MRIDKVLKSGDVERFHACTGMTKQRNSEHQWGVALLCHYFSPSCRKEVILAALTHDAPEFITGDIPSTVKWSLHGLKEMLDGLEKEIEKDWGINFQITPAEKYLLKICDMFEGMQYCIKRAKMGELGAILPFRQWINFIDEKYISRMNVSQKVFYDILLKQMNQLDLHPGE